MYVSPSVEVSTSRVAVWYRLRLPVIFRWNDGEERIEGGFTNDVAVDGALILSSKCPPVGCDIRLEVLIPCPDRVGDEFRIECIGKVTRVLEKPGWHVFGVDGVFDDQHLAKISTESVLR